MEKVHSVYVKFFGLWILSFWYQVVNKIKYEMGEGWRGEGERCDVHKVQLMWRYGGSHSDAVYTIPFHKTGAYLWTYNLLSVWYGHWVYWELDCMEEPVGETVYKDSLLNA